MIQNSCARHSAVPPLTRFNTWQSCCKITVKHAHNSKEQSHQQLDDPVPAGTFQLQFGRCICRCMFRYPDCTWVMHAVWRRYLWVFPCEPVASPGAQQQQGAPSCRMAARAAAQAVATHPLMEPFFEAEQDDDSCMPSKPFKRSNTALKAGRSVGVSAQQSVISFDTSGWRSDGSSGRDFR
eukprot:349894-Chlamydomonas_euryale.AAC.7